MRSFFLPESKGAFLDPNASAGKSIEDIFRDLKTSETGLSAAEAARRLKKYGPNEIAEKKKIRPFLILF